MKPKISVGIPAYNSGRFIAEAIRSVLDQTFSDFEIIICDDRSTDNTEQVVRSFNDKRMRYVKNEARLGPAGNFNRCIMRSSGEYMYIFHSDDVMLKDNLKKKADILSAYPDVGLVHSGWYKIDGTGKVLSRDGPENDYIRGGVDYFKDLILLSPFICAPSVMVRKECYDKLGGFNSRFPYCCDYDMWLRFPLFYSVSYLSEPLIKYRVYGGNMSLSSGGGHILIEHNAINKEVINKYREYIPNIEQLKMGMARKDAKEIIAHSLYTFVHFQWVASGCLFIYAIKLLYEHGLIFDIFTITSKVVFQWVKSKFRFRFIGKIAMMLSIYHLFLQFNL